MNISIYCLFKGRTPPDIENNVHARSKDCREFRLLKRSQISERDTPNIELIGLI